MRVVVIWFCCLVILSLSGFNVMLMFFDVVRVGIRLNFWKMNLIFCVLIWFSFVGEVDDRFLLFSIRLLLVGVLSVLSSCRSVDLFFLVGFWMVMNLLGRIFRLMFVRVFMMCFFCVQVCVMLFVWYSGLGWVELGFVGVRFVMVMLFFLCDVQGWVVVLFM